MIGVAINFFPGVLQIFTNPGSNTGCYSKLISGGYPFSHLSINVGTSAGSISVAVYHNSGAGMSAAPTGGLQSPTPAAIACPAAGLAAVSLGGSVTPNLGDWVALSVDNATATFQRPETTATLSMLDLPGWGSYQASAHPLPSVPRRCQRPVPSATT